ncbi:MAG: carboxymuconolactone decarboxylase family protein [Burkholderiaceae bacterium]|jgi:alkylhydroperoxidase family enzyme|nr:carboxymuconolactone decarboxylase family protein [Burkholderiaceae bacterium]
MRLPDWTPERKPQPAELVDAIKARRGGTLINLDKALLWSEPLARGWNTYLRAVRTELPTSRRLRELGICTVALLTGAHYEYHHHAPDFLAAGGSQAQLDALQAFLRADPRGIPDAAVLDELDRLVIRYAAQMTLDVQVSDEVFDALRRHFDETGLVELTSAIATYNMVARFLVALQITPEK